MAFERITLSIFRKYRIQTYFVHRMYHKLFVRYPECDSNKISFEFFYPMDQSDKIRKHFSFLRSKDEEIDTFLSRLKIKVNVEFEKLIKKKQKKNPDIINYYSEYFVDNVSLRDESNKDITNGKDSLQSFINGKSILNINGTEYIAVINTPSITSAKLPRMIISNCPIVPTVKIEHGKLADIDVEWFVSSNNQKWKSIYLGHSFTPTDYLINKFLKIVCSCAETEQQIETQSRSQISASPIQNFLTHRWQQTPLFLTDSDKFRFLSYNILADVYSDTALAKSNLFVHCPLEYLSIDYRQHLLSREIVSYHSDIVCLQEVDRDAFEHRWQPLLSLLGYEGIFVAKAAAGMEGQAIFWRRSRFNMLSEISIDSLAKYVLDNSDSSELISLLGHNLRSSSQQLQRWMEMRQCMAGCVLQTASGAVLIVANTHLYFRPEASTVRLFQMAAILDRVDKAREQYPEAAVLVCGDFNDFRGSPLLRFLEQGEVTVDPDVAIRHRITSLTSAYKGTAFTNFVPGFSAELDFIFHNDRLTCERTLPLPSVDDVTESVALPNKDFPSDHLALVAEFRMC